MINELYPSMQSASQAFGIPEEVLRSAKKAGCPAFRPNNSLNVIEFIAWYFKKMQEGENGILDESKERAKKLAEETLALIDKRKIRDGVLVERPLVDKDIWEFCLLPLRQALLVMPSEQAHLCNPDNSEVARVSLQGWVDKTLETIREPLEEKK